MAAVRYVPSDASHHRNHGVNLQRVMADGDLNTSGLTDTYGEQMPWTLSGGLFNVCDGAALDGTYTQHLNDVLHYAQQNGQSVLLDFFNGSVMKTNWNSTHINAWRPSANNMRSCTCSANLPNPGHGDPFPEFYDICQDGYSNTNPCSSLNCLGKMQKNLVDKVIDVVMSGSGSNNTSPYKNVIFELMNEADSSEISTTQWTMYYKWHNTVAQWIKNRAAAAYLVVANPGTTYTQITNCCPNCGGISCSCTPNDCVNNPAQVYMLSNVDVASLHYTQWQVNGVQDSCQGAKAAHWRFKKPILIDDDGGSGARNNNTSVKTWATAATGSGCFAGVGKVHFNHLDEMKYMPASSGTNTCGPNPAETSLQLDCEAQDKLADALPKNLCSGSGMCSGCASNYCFEIYHPASCATGAGNCGN